MRLKSYLPYVLWFVLAFPFSFLMAIVFGLGVNALFNTGEYTVWFMVPVALLVSYFLMRFLRVMEKRHHAQVVVFKVVFVVSAVVLLAALIVDPFDDESPQFEMCIFDSPFKCSDFGIVDGRVFVKMVSAEVVRIHAVKIEKASGGKTVPLGCDGLCGLPGEMLQGGEHEISFGAGDVKEGSAVECIVTITVDRDGVFEDVKGGIFLYS